MHLYTHSCKNTHARSHAAAKGAKAAPPPAWGGGGSLDNTAATTAAKNLSRVLHASFASSGGVMLHLLVCVCLLCEQAQPLNHRSHVHRLCTSVVQPIRQHCNTDSFALPPSSLQQCERPSRHPPSLTPPLAEALILWHHSNSSSMRRVTALWASMHLALSVQVQMAARWVVRLSVHAWMCFV